MRASQPLPRAFSMAAWISASPKPSAGVGVPHHVAARAPQDGVLDVEGGADGRAVVAGGRLGEQLAELRSLEDLAVGDGVQRAAAGQRQLVEAGAALQVLEDVEEDLLVDHLGAVGDVGPLAEELRILRIARRAQQVGQLGREDQAHLRRPVVPGHLHAFRVVAEVVEVQLEPPVVDGVNELPELVDVGRLAVRRQAHHLPLLAVAVKADELRDGRVEEAGRVRELDPVDDLQLPIAPHAAHRRHEVAEAVDRQAGRLLERRDEERAGDVRLVVLDGVELGLQRPRLDPQRGGQRLVDAADLGHVGQAILHQLGERRSLLDREQDLLVEVGLGIARDGHVIQLGGGDARRLQDRLGRQPREAGAVLAAIEPLLFHRAHQLTVLDQRDGGVAVVGIDS